MYLSLYLRTLFSIYTCGVMANNYVVTLQLKRQVNGFWIVELIIVNDFRQVCVCLCRYNYYTVLQYDSQGLNLANTVSRALSITNEVDSVSCSIKL